MQMSEDSRYPADPRSGIYPDHLTLRMTSQVVVVCRGELSLLCLELDPEVNPDG